MSPIERLAEAVRKGQPIPVPMAALLNALTPLTRAGMWLRLRSRDRVRVDARVISFGNITTGGTGKTPAVIERARFEIAAGNKVGILTRGYGASRNGAEILIGTGHEAAEMPHRFGDEPALIGSKLPDVWIARARRRDVAAKILVQKYDCNVLILDDGFQFVRLARDENHVVIDATNPFGNGRLFPRGTLREPVSALRRATHVLLTRCDQAPHVVNLVHRLREMLGDVPIRRTRHAPTVLYRLRDRTVFSLEYLRGPSFTPLCAIGNPEAFFQTLESLGAHLHRRIALRDHHSIHPSIIPDNLPVVVTEKDAIRIRNAPDNLFVLGIELRDL